MTNLTLLVLLAPLLGFVILGVAGSALTNRAIITIAWGPVASLFFLRLSASSRCLVRLLRHDLSDQVFYTWVCSGDFQLSFGLLFIPYRPQC